MCDTCGCAEKGDMVENTVSVEVMENLLSDNDRQAELNRQHLSSRNIFSINLMGSPGSGKTTLLEKTIDAVKGALNIAVIEGDLETERDAERIRARGVPAFQIVTGTACHLNAKMVHRGLHSLPLEDIDILFIENVGNLVCPASFDLGADLNVVMLSVPEGDDKPMKYPVMFKAGDAAVISKADLLPFCQFNIDDATERIRMLNAEAKIIVTGNGAEEGLAEWIDFLKGAVSEKRLIKNNHA